MKPVAPHRMISNSRFADIGYFLVCCELLVRGATGSSVFGDCVRLLCSIKKVCLYLRITKAYTVRSGSNPELTLVGVLKFYLFTVLKRYVKNS